MFISRLKLKNWRNFRAVDVPLRQRQFLVGPNASGKSNLLDALRFLRDVANEQGGGLQAAIQRRGGLSRIRCLGARKDPEVAIGVTVSTPNGNGPRWEYEIGLHQESRGFRRQILTHENVWMDGESLLCRGENEDPERRKETYLEQVTNNERFRELRTFFQGISYAHLVPQLVRHADSIQGRVVDAGPSRTGREDQQTNPRKQVADDSADSHRDRAQIEGHPVRAGSRQRTAASFGAPRALATPRRAAERDRILRRDAPPHRAGLGLLDGDGPLLLEEPELSLHQGVVERLSSLLYRAQKRNKRQVLLSTHSSELLRDGGIGGEEVLILEPGDEGTEVTVSSSLRDIQAVLAAGVSVGEAVIARTRPAGFTAGRLPL